jgi:hypothetical protein
MSTPAALDTHLSTATTARYVTVREFSVAVNRRRLLTLAVAGVLSGCTSDTSPDPTSAPATPSDDGQRTPPPVADDVAEAFEVVSIDAPSQTELNNGWAFSVTVRNTTDRPLTFASPLSFRARGGEWEQFDGQIQIPTTAGGTATWESPTSAFGYLGRYDYRLDAVDRTWSVEVMRKSVDFGVYYATPAGLTLNITDVSIRAEPPGVNDSSSTDTTTPNDGAWLLATLLVRNRGDENRRTPRARGFSLTVDGGARQRPTLSRGSYEATDLAPGSQVRGTLVYPVPNGTQDTDVTLWWEQEYDTGRVAASWDR